MFWIAAYMTVGLFVVFLLWDSDGDIETQLATAPIHDFIFLFIGAVFLWPVALVQLARKR